MAIQIRDILYELKNRGIRVPKPGFINPIYPVDIKHIQGVLANNGYTEMPQLDNGTELDDTQTKLILKEYGGHKLTLEELIARYDTCTDKHRIEKITNLSSILPRIPPSKETVLFAISVEAPSMDIYWQWMEEDDGYRAVDESVVQSPATYRGRYGRTRVFCKVALVQLEKIIEEGEYIQVNDIGTIVTVQSQWSGLHVYDKDGHMVGPHTIWIINYLVQKGFELTFIHADVAGAAHYTESTICYTMRRKTNKERGGNHLVSPSQSGKDK